MSFVFGWGLPSPIIESHQSTELHELYAVQLQCKETSLEADKAEDVITERSDMCSLC